jgi:hypothetical protein
MVTKVIDALIVTLGLDSSGYQKGSKEAVKQLGVTRNAVVKTSGDMSRAINGAARSFALAFLGFSTSSGLARMLTGLNESARQMGILAKNTGTDVQNLKNYSNAFAIAGGTAEGFLRTIEQLQQLQGRAQMTGVSGWEKFLNVLNVGLLERGDDGIIRARDKLKVLAEISDALVARSNKLGRPAAYSFASEMGFDPATINVLLQGSAAVNKLVGEQEKLAQNQATLAERAEKLRAQWQELARRVENLASVLLERLQPYIDKAFAAFDRWLSGDNFENAIDNITEAVRSLADQFQRLGDFIDKARSFGDSLPKWMTKGSEKFGKTPDVSDVPWIKAADDRIAAIWKGITGGGVQGGLAAVPGTWQSNRAKYLPTIQDAARVNDVPAELLEKLIGRESGWASDVISGKRRSSAGAVGIAQLMPQFFPGAGQNADADIWTAAEYLAKLKNQFGSWEDAAAAYNAGPGTLNAVKNRRGGLPTETSNYVNALFGAGAANRVSAPAGTGTVLAQPNSASNSTQIGTINIYPPVGTSEAMRRDLVRAIERKGIVNQADYGVRP